MWIALPLTCFGLLVILHGVWMRIPLRIDSVRRFLLLGIPVGGALVIYSIATFGPTVPAFSAILLYAFLCELYLFFFTLAVSSVSATMLIILRKGPMQASTLERTHDSRGMVKLRLDRLIKNGFIEHKDNRLTVTAKGMRLHQTFSALRRFFRHELP